MPDDELVFPAPPAPASPPAPLLEEADEVESPVLVEFDGLEQLDAKRARHEMARSVDFIVVTPGKIVKTHDGTIRVATQQRLLIQSTQLYLIKLNKKSHC